MKSILIISFLTLFGHIACGNLISETTIQNESSIKYKIYAEEVTDYVRRYNHYDYIKVVKLNGEISNETKDTLTILCKGDNHLSNIIVDTEKYLKRAPREKGIVKPKIIIPPFSKSYFSIPIQKRNPDLGKVSVLYNMTYQFANGQISDRIFENELSISNNSIPCKYFEEKNIYEISHELAKESKLKVEFVAKEVVERNKQHDLFYSSPQYSIALEITCSLLNETNDTLYYLASSCLPNDNRIRYSQEEINIVSRACTMSKTAMYKILPKSKETFNVFGYAKNLTDSVRLGYDFFQIPDNFDLNCIRELGIRTHTFPLGYEKYIIWNDVQFPK